MPARLLRALAALPLLAGMGVAGSAAGVTPVTVGCAASAHRAALVVEHGDGSVITRCVGFDSQTITGEQLLDLSGIEWQGVDYGSMGKGVCQVDEEPSSYPPGCWTSSSPYWAMFVSRAGGAWSGADRGVSSEAFGDGDAEGFHYQAQSSNSPPPPAAGVCTAATATAPPAAAATAPAARAGQPSAAAATPVPAASAVSAATSRAIQQVSSAATPPAAAAGIAAAPAAASVDIGVAAAVALGGGLLGLLSVQLLRRRRRAPPP